VQERISPLIDSQISFAHRGARAHLPENTIDAFELAIRLGATGLESDTWITRDGIAVLDHDGVVKGRIRNKPISNFNRSELWFRFAPQFGHQGRQQHERGCADDD
jgi:glycerophosphoryl diester phosphodiesterase